ncbi:rhombosortase [Oceanobacter kriegii]|uniref:rhombosortase n=1 Tax=Oceanobacter kriegii TaxID=64972 RepID=UPI0004130DCE|nr:rhombosortase [Oceanobacter kriegii]
MSVHIPSHGGVRTYLPWLLFSFLLLLLVWMEPASAQWLEFHRSDIQEGEYWRLLTANLVHLSWFHAFGNVGGWLLAAWLLGASAAFWRVLLLVVWCSLWVGTGLWWFADELQRYSGFSGALHGVLLVMPFWSVYYSRRFAIGFAAVLVAKVLWEQTDWYNDMAMVELIGGRVEARAHLLGVLAGGTALLLVSGWRQFFHPSGRHAHEH